MTVLPRAIDGLTSMAIDTRIRQNDTAIEGDRRTLRHTRMATATVATLKPCETVTSKTAANDTVSTKNKMCTRPWRSSVDDKPETAAP